MNHTVNCIKLKQEAEGLDRQPYPGQLGERIYNNVSKIAWQEWLRAQTILINENRLNPLDPKAVKFLEREMEQYFFGQNVGMPK